MNKGTLGFFEIWTLLGVLNLKENEAHSAKIKLQIQNVSGKTVAHGAIFATLSRLEEKGYLTTSMREPQPVRGGRRAKLYSVSPKGFASLRESLRIQDQFRANVQPKAATKLTTRTKQK